ncbi:hypothetical protein [Scytonema sp. PCC 10023]
MNSYLRSAYGRGFKPATNAYAYGTSDDERSNWCGVSPNDKTDTAGT